MVSTETVVSTETEGVRSLTDAQALAKIAKIWRRQANRGPRKKSTAARWERIWSQVTWAALKENLDSELSQEAIEGFEQSLVDEVRGPDYTITNLFREIVSLKHAFADVVSASSKLDANLVATRGCGLGSFLDGLFERCMAKTSLIDELVVEGSARGYCQVDAQGRIISANAAMSRLLHVVDCRGIFLPKLFGSQEAFVATALCGHAGGAPVLRRMDLVADNGHKIPVTAEFGQIAINHTTRAGYAIVVDVSSIIQAEYQAYEASKLGILKFDLDLCITYANRTARIIFGYSEIDLVGTSVGKLFPEPETQAKIQDEVARRQKGEGSTYELPYHRASDGKSCRCGSTPCPNTTTWTL